VNVASRIASQAAAGSVYVGEAVVDAAAPEGFALREVGPVELKGIAEPMRLFEAVRES
jgi:class 3 adenylate cyclase